MLSEEGRKKNKKKPPSNLLAIINIIIINAEPQLTMKLISLHIFIIEILKATTITAKMQSLGSVF